MTLINKNILLVLIYFLLFVFAPFSTVKAEDPSSSIDIDRSVLDELNRYYGAQSPAQQPVKLSPPVENATKSFPVKDTITHRTHYPPSVKDDILELLAAPEIPAPIPATKPEDNVPEDNVVENSVNQNMFSQRPSFVPPLPPRRPVVQKASQSFVERARQKEKKIVHSGGPDPGPRMPAVPKAVVEKQELIPPASMENSVPRPPEDSTDNSYITLVFEVGDKEMNEKHIALLQRDVLPLILQNSSWRLQIQAFASPTDDGVSSARRVSLSRALSVRSYLLDQGIESPRMDVRALGAQTDRQPTDRIDIVFLPPTLQ